jgi:uncharacterized protein YjdB
MTHRHCRGVITVNGAFMSVFRVGRIVAASGLIFFAACVDGYSSSPKARPVEIASVAAGPTALVLRVGQMQQLTAVVTDADGHQVSDRVVRWETDSPNVAVVSDAGLVRATGLGYVTITATCEGKTFGLAATVVED